MLYILQSVRLCADMKKRRERGWCSRGQQCKLCKTPVGQATQCEPIYFVSMVGRWSNLFSCWISSLMSVPVVKDVVQKLCRIKEIWKNCSLMWQFFLMVQSAYVVSSSWWFFDMNCVQVISTWEWIILIVFCQNHAYQHHENHHYQHCHQYLFHFLGYSRFYWLSGQERSLYWCMELKMLHFYTTIWRHKFWVMSLETHSSSKWSCFFKSMISLWSWYN